MSIQLPSRTPDQMQQIYDGIAVNAYYPYSFRIRRLITSPNFPSIDTPGSGQFLQFVWTPAISISIKSITLGGLLVGGSSSIVGQQISVNSGVNFGDSTDLTHPADEANILARTTFSVSFPVYEENFGHGGYYIAAQTPIYINYWVDVGAIGGGSLYYGWTIFHAMQTDRRV